MKQLPNDFLILAGIAGAIIVTIITLMVFAYREANRNLKMHVRMIQRPITYTFKPAPRPSVIHRVIRFLFFNRKH